MSIDFSVTIDGLTATVDALTPIVSGVSAYFASTARAIATPVPVYAGDWEEWKNTSDGPPGRVIITQTDFELLDPGQWPGESGLRFAPGAPVQIDDTHAAPVRLVRAQNFKVWVLGLVAKGAAFSTQDPAAYELAQQVAAFALADLTGAALRDLHGHPLGPVRWTPMGPERGAFAYGSVLVGGFGPIPIPVLGDVITYVTPNSAQASIIMPPATTGDTVTSP